MDDALVLALLAAFAASLILTPIGGALVARLGGIDQPGERRSHVRPTSRGGGVGIVLVLVAWLLWQGVVQADAAWQMLALACLVMGGLGLADDLRDLSALTRIVAQAGIAGMLVALLAPGFLALGPWHLTGSALVFPLLFLGTLTAVNFSNFMDGINGLAGMQAVFVGATLAALAVDAGDSGLAACCLGLAVAAAGFLPWNAFRARVFMGDVGSTVLGLAVAGIAIAGTARGAWPILLPLLVSSLFLVDAAATLLRRMWLRERWYTAHRDHAYQRLVDRGWSHQQVSGLYLAVNLLVILPVAWLSRDSAQVHPLVCISTWTLLTILWGLARRR